MESKPWSFQASKRRGNHNTEKTVVNSEDHDKGNAGRPPDNVGDIDMFSGNKSAENAAGAQSLL